MTPILFGSMPYSLALYRTMEIALCVSCNAIGISGVSCLLVLLFQLHAVFGTRYFTIMQVTPASVSQLQTSAPRNPSVLFCPIAKALNPPPGKMRIAGRADFFCAG